jgi:two-component system, response regulator YesN
LRNLMHKWKEGFLMLKILVVDDESIVIDSIKYIIERNFSEAVIAGTARSGREAIEIAEEIKPDLIFMDIKMPGINGIEAIKEIKTHYSNALFVIISACEQFEFAKEAVKLGVFEYLLKPVNRMKIIEIVKKASDLLAEGREKRRKELELKEKIESVLPILEHGFIFSILLFEDFREEMEKYRRIFDINEESGFIMTIEFGEEERPGNLGNVIGSNVLSHTFYPNLRDILKSTCKCIVGPVMLNRIVVYVPTEIKSDEYSERLETLETADRIYKKLSEKINTDFYIGIGSKIKGNENLLTSYSESLKAIKYASQKGIFHIKDIPQDREVKSDYLDKREKYLIEKVSLGDTTECIITINNIFDRLVTEFNDSTEEIKGRLVELVVILHRLAMEYEIEENDIFNRKNYLVEFLSISNMSELKVWCKKRIDYIAQGIKASRNKRLSNIVTIAKTFINEYYYKELALEDVSKEVKLSPHYFSKFFKEETGENFIDYLTYVRISNAKTLLETGKLNIKEVCFKVGYNDPNYFSKIFKKVTGLTPTDFKA